MIASFAGTGFALLTPDPGVAPFDCSQTRMGPLRLLLDHAPTGIDVQSLLQIAECARKPTGAGITPNPIPAVSSSNLGDRSGRQFGSYHSLWKEYMKRRFDYRSVRLRFDQNAYSTLPLPACTSSPARMLRETRCSRTPIPETERILCVGEGLSESLLFSRIEHPPVHQT